MKGIEPKTRNNENAPTFAKCTQCGKEFRLSPSDVIRSNNLFCSQKCVGLYQRAELSTETQQEIVDRYQGQKESTTAIAAAMNISMWIVSEELNRQGIPRRTRSIRAHLSWKNATDERIATARERGILLARITSQEPEHIRRKRAMVAAAAAQKRHGPTSIERKMRDELETMGIEYIFQFPVGDKFLCDFCIPKAKLIIECDGAYWHDRPAAKRRDASKDAYLRACGYTVMRFTDREINSAVHNCVAKIVSYLEIPESAPFIRR